MNQTAVAFKTDVDHSFLRFLIIWVGQLISNIGSGLTAFALGIYVFQLTGSATVYSLILLSAFLPSLLLKPIGGTLADRVNRKKLMMIGDFGSAMGLIFIIAMISMGIKDLWVIYLGTIISSIFVAFQNPAYKAQITDLVSKEFYAKASGLLQLSESSKYLISPIIAVFLLKIMDIKEVLILDIASFLIAIFTVFLIKRSYAEAKQKVISKRFSQDFMDGFHYLCSRKSILLLISIISFVAFFIGLLQALLGPMILSFTNPQIFGISQTISVTGMLIGSCFIGIFGKFNKKIQLLSFSLIISGLFFSLIGVSANIWVVTLFCFLFFLFLPFANTSLDVLVRSNVENDMQGRVWSIVSLISQLGMAISFAVAGYLADYIFNPWLEPDGMLASSVGTLIGIGKGRGIGLIFIISGIFVITIAIFIGRLKLLKKLDAAV